ncbi:phosphatidylinositol-specific phospholipase C domain-containing protein [Streptomyces vinaceus]|uniref:phosphatidylinositol-specific phospholipase C domain-containing protein n=1 Tax=Streptomyces vinaceus TaxID=1960 RepID=UPI00380BC857
MPHTTSSDTGVGSRRRRLSRLPARLIAVCAALGAVLLAPGTTGTAEAAGSVNGDAYWNIGEPNRAADWMKNVSGGTWLAAMSLPGTHDTLSIHGGSLTQTQEDYGDGANTLAAQLERGIRAIDVRVRVTENKYFTVHHGVVYQEANFDDVLGKARDFLARHPGETVVMRLRAECPLTGGGVADCANDPKTVDHAKIEEIFGRYLNAYPGLFYAPSVKKNEPAPVPLLSQVRGKIVLGSFDGVANTYGTKTFNSNQEDHWAAETVPKKWQYVKENIDAAVRSGTGEMFVTYTSASKGLDRSPAQYAGGYRSVQGGVTTDVLGVNYQLMTYLNQGGGNGHLGIVMMDFPGWALVDNIIARNDGGVVKGGNRGLWLVNADKTYVNSAYGRCMVRGPEFDSSKSGGLVTQRACQSPAPSSHQWGAEHPSTYDGKGYFQVKASNGKCLTVPYNNGTAPPAGTQLFWWDCETRWFSASQLWNVVPVQIGTADANRTAYRFVNHWTGLCLSMDPATAGESGGKVTQDTCPK